MSNEEALAALESQIEAFGAGDDDLDEGTGQTPETPVEAQSAPEAPQQQAQIATLDAILDDPTLPENWRGKKLRELYEDRLNMTHQAHRAGQEKNDWQARATAAETALAMLKEMQAAQRPPEQPVKKRTVLESAGVDPDTELVTRPREFFDRTFDAFGREINQEVTGKLQEVVAPLQQQLQQLQMENLRQKGEALYSQGFELVNARGNGRVYSREQWNELAKPITQHIVAAQLNPLDPTTYVKAVEYYESLFPASAPAAAPTPVAAPAPQIANPPVGGSRPATVGAPGSPKPQVDKRIIAEATRLANEFGFDKDKLIEKLAANPETKRHFA